MVPLLFGMGIVVDFLWTRTVSAVSQRRGPPAVAYAIVFNVITMGSTWMVIEARTVPGLLAFAVGGGLGTALGLWKRNSPDSPLDGATGLSPSSKGQDTVVEEGAPSQGGDAGPNPAGRRIL